MALLITKKCINCDMCEPECPNQAISVGVKTYEINPERCTECKGFYEKPTCQSVCPINNCITINPDYIETDKMLIEKFVTLFSDDLS